MVVEGSQLIIWDLLSTYTHKSETFLIYISLILDRIVMAPLTEGWSAQPRDMPQVMNFESYKPSAPNHYSKEVDLDSTIIIL